MATPRLKTIEDRLREQLRELESKHSGLGLEVAGLQQEAAAWKAKYIASGSWRKYLPTAAVALVVGFALGLLA